MRFWIFIVAVLAFAGLAVKKFFFSGSDNPDSVLTSFLPKNEMPSTTETPSPSSIVPYKSDGLAATSETKTIETVTESYTFQHREAPQTLSTLGDQFELLIVVDSHTRSVFYSGTALTVSDFTRYLKSIDHVGGACAVQTWAVFVDKNAQSGFDFVATLNALVKSPTSATIGNGGFVLDIGASNISAALKLIADGSTVEVLQRPHVRLEHGTTSIIESIQEVPVPSTTTSQGIAQTSIEYRKVGLQLSVLPHFLGSDRVRLVVKQSNGLIGNTVQIDGNDVPVIQSQTVDTSTTVTVGQTVILGGVTTRRETLTRGLLRNTKEVSEGSLYVILSTYSDEPKAVPVSQLSLPRPRKELIPFTTEPESSAEWIDGQLLPPKHVLPIVK